MLKRALRNIRDKKRFAQNAAEMRATFDASHKAMEKKGEVKNQLKLSEISVAAGSELKGLFQEPSNYAELVGSIRAEADKRLANSKDTIVHFIHRAKDKPFNEAQNDQVIAELPEYADRSVRNLFVRDTKSIPGVSELVEDIAAQLERNVYGCYLKTDYISYYRTLDSRYPETASLLWHADNHYDQVLKFFIYMSDVTEDDAPFEYIRHPKTKKAVHIKPQMPQLYPQGRIPFQLIDQLVRSGYESVKVTGEAGTAMLLNDKIIHRANFAHKGHHRDALMIQFSPCLPGEPRISEKTKAY